LIFEQQQLRSSLRILGVLETCLYVDNLAAAEEFYHGVLGLTLYSRQAGRHVFLRCGSGMLLLFVASASRLPGDAPPHGTQGPGHVAFAVHPTEIAQWRHHLRRRHVVIEREITWPHGGDSIYFRDPAGNSVELATSTIWDEHPAAG
jgi:catechol 2,3-dioxygenase-like lactoylglutathione lyase family enzyme